MKNRINILSIFSFLTIILVHFSCAKEELLPVVQTDQVSPRMAFDKTEELLEFKTFDDALESIKFDEDPRWRVEIKAYNCRGIGQTLIVYNPNEHALNFYDSKRFAVYWFKGNQPIARNVDYKLGCVCQGKYAAIVFNRFTQTAIGIAFHSITTSCSASDDVAAPIKNNN